MSSSKLPRQTAGRPGRLRRAEDDRKAAYVVAARRRLRGRSWINGQEVGGTDARYMHLEHTYD